MDKVFVIRHKVLADDFFDEEIEDPNHTFREYLPRKYIQLYSSGFLMKFYVTLLTVGYKLALPNATATLLSCTVEELALHILIERASEILEMDNIEVDYSYFEDMIYQDVDFEFLYEPQLDGIEDSTEIGIGNLHFSEWFKPFDNASFPIHPICQDEE